ncbi:MAG: methyl-accepting chemotaxis protein [Colwellia sp.]|nr:methyl-accepting chemotaxis protein [Colwellia sp.]
MNQWLKNVKIRHALIAIITVSLLTLSLAGILLSNNAFTNVSENSIESELLPNQLAKVAARINLQLSTPLVLSKAITQNKFLIDWALAGEPDNKQQEVIDFLALMKTKNNALTVFWVSNVSQNYLNQDGVLKKINPDKDKWFDGFLNSDKPFEIAFDFEEGTSQLTAFVNYRVAAQGKNLAIAGLGYSVSEISADILSNKIGETGYVFVTDNDGNVIIHPYLSSVKKHKLRSFDGFAKVSSKLLQKSADYVFDKVNYKSVDYYVASVGVPELNWKIIAMLPVDEPMSAVRAALSQTALLNIILAIGFVLLMVSVANRITKPIVDIGDRLLEMAKSGGDLTQQLDANRGDELGRLAQGFNAIIEKVHNIMLDIKTTEQVMESSFAKLAAIADDVDGCAKSQQAESDSVAAATTQMNQSIQEVSNLAGSTADKAELTQSQVEDINKQVGDTNQVMQQLDISNISTQEKIQALADQTQTISSVIDTISSISEQTNLLALNAAIEAARAGEQGRGFAVVADEVRSLAARTKDSTREINDVIEKLQQQAQETVLAMAQNSELAKEGLEKTNTASEALKGVVTEINEITNMNTSVATATNQQSSVIGELNVNITRIADMSAQVADLSENTKEELQDLEVQKVRLAALVAQFKTKA